MFPSSLVVALTGLGLGLLALVAFAWGWRHGQYSHLRGEPRHALHALDHRALARGCLRVRDVRAVRLHVLHHAEDRQARVAQRPAHPLAFLAGARGHRDLRHRAHHRWCAPRARDARSAGPLSPVGRGDHPRPVCAIVKPGWESPGTTAIVQLLGPNIGAVGGATLGALFGAFRRRRPRRAYARAAENASAILLVVRTQSRSEVAPIEQVLTASGGRDIRVEE